MAKEGGPYHDFRVLSDVFISGRVQDQPAGVGVQAVDVEDAVLGVAPRPLQHLRQRAGTGEGRPLLTQTREESPSAGFGVLHTYVGENERNALLYGYTCEA